MAITTVLFDLDGTLLPMDVEAFAKIYIVALAKEHNLFIIEDACQAIGAEYKGKRVGTFAEYGAFSFFPSKNLGCFGDGGGVSVTDEEKAKLSHLPTSLEQALDAVPSEMYGRAAFLGNNNFSSQWKIKNFRDNKL